MTIRLNETLRPLRLQAGLTQSALAAQLDVSDRAVSRWERGEAYPDVTLLPALAALLHVSVNALLGVDGQRRQAAIARAQAELGRADAGALTFEQALAAADAFAVHDGCYAAPWLSGTQGKATEPDEARRVYALLLEELDAPAFAELRGNARVEAAGERARQALARLG